MIVLTGILCAYMLRFNFDIPDHEMPFLPISVITVVSVRTLSFIFAKTFRGVIRYTSSDDILRITSVVALGSIVVLIGNIISFKFTEKYLVPTSVIFIEFFCTLIFLVIPRLMVKLLYHEYKYKSKPKWDVIIYGAGELGVITKRTLDRDRAKKYNIIGFVAENNKKVYATIEGIKVYHYNDFDTLLANNNVSHVIISTHRLEMGRKQEIIEKCLDKNITVRHVPPVENWINGELSFNQIKHVRIEDLLGRDEIVVDFENISQTLKNKTILVTGAAGSIGSELVKQILKFTPHRVVLFDQAESGLYDLNVELENTFSNRLWNLVIGDIRDGDRLRRVFELYKPEIVFHAAAYKHVPLMEENVEEAFKTNILGTKNLADMAVEFLVEKFIMISTDKAVNPTNVMGASKRVAEIYIQSLNKRTSTLFITTRFGNVLGSNGSVIPLFKKQIQKGGPITVTHPDVTRYFMTIPEACKLVLEAGSAGKGGEIFVFDMGESVKIIDLAKKMVQLSGLTIGKDIEIRFTGLRPGEKLHEELLDEKESLLPTHHSKILIGKVREYDFNEVSDQIKELTNISKQPNQQELLVKKIKQLVPEYKSQNSEFCLLDA